MFHSVSMPWYVNLIFPRLQASKAAEHIISAVENKDLVVRLPRSLDFVCPVLGLLPWHMRDFVTELAGGLDAIDTFCHYKAKRT